MIRYRTFALLLFCTAHAAAYESTHESLRVKQGDTFSVSLSSLAPAGYTWQIAPSGIDETYATLISDVYQTKSKLIGAAGVQTFTFKAQKSGTTTIILDYKRPWEKEIVKTHSIELTIVKNKKTR